MDPLPNIGCTLPCAEEQTTPPAIAASSTLLSSRASLFPRAGRLMLRFVQARRLAKDDPDGMASMCQQLLANDDLETAMRAGDVFAALVDYFFERGNWQQCYSLMGR